MGENAHGDRTILHIEWEQRGCLDQGAVAFELRIDEIPDDGWRVEFAPRPEGGCVEALIGTDHEVTGVSVVDCTTAVS